jgi:hypothetical protein
MEKMGKSGLPPGGGTVWRVGEANLKFNNNFLKFVVMGAIKKNPGGSVKDKKS